MSIAPKSGCDPASLLPASARCHIDLSYKYGDDDGRRPDRQKEISLAGVVRQSRQSRMTALYLERYLNYGLTRAMMSGKPLIGIAQTGSDLSPCNRHHIELAKRVREASSRWRHPVRISLSSDQETGKRPTAALDRNLAYLSLVEVLLRLSARRRRADHRLRQDHAGPADGRGHRQHPGHRAVGRADAEWLAQGQAHRLRHHRLGIAPAPVGGRDRL